MKVQRLVKGSILPLVLAILSQAHAEQVPHRRQHKPLPPLIAPGDVHHRTDFTWLTPAVPIAGDLAAAPSAGGTISALPGGGALILDEDSGDLVRVDDHGKAVDHLTIAPGAAQLAVDAKTLRAYVADRNNDRIAVVSLKGAMRVESSRPTTREPYGVALSPDHLLLVTTVADRKLHAFDLPTAKLLWTLDLGPEPRAVAVSADGREAVVTYLTTSAIARIELDRRKPRLRFSALAADHTPTPENRIGEILAHGLVPERFARNAFAATFVGDTALVAYQQSTPKMPQRVESRGTYGGSLEGNPPVLQRLAFLPRGAQSPARAHVQMQMSRAMTYDPKTDRLYLADLATDTIVALADVSRAHVWQLARLGVGDGSACGPNGVSITEGGELWVYCSFQRTAVRARIETDHGGKVSAEVIGRSTPLAQSRLSDSQRRGRELFHKGADRRLSAQGALSCAHCHAEGRADGLSWRIEGMELQTPLLAGRIAGAHPFKWDGKDKDLPTSLRNTVLRLGGQGLGEQDVKDLQSYLESLPRPRVPARAAVAVARGEQLFRSKTLGCAGCHTGKLFADQKLYDLGDDLDKVNTPSLLGLAISAPYYHDGSAASLRALLLENGTVHGMGRLDNLQSTELDDLIAYLETL